MKKVLLTAVCMAFAVAASAQTFEKVKELEIITTGGSIDVTAVKGKTTSVNVSALDAKHCTTEVRQDNERELKIKISKKTPASVCKPNIIVTTQAKVPVEIDAMDTQIVLNGLEKAINLDIKNSQAKLSAIAGSLDIEAKASTVVAEGKIKKLDIEGNGSNIQTVWTKKPGSKSIELEGSNNVMMAFPAGTKKVPVKQGEFTGNLVIQ
ncbi:hypothetical protein AAIR98_000278 [Elusimicrobium simillimum]|uniref:hypothetical protein n=1 Tax=Elusimicrobium simillimum TaxID=3143438 RepID=UPI003C6EAFC1